MKNKSRYFFYGTTAVAFLYNAAGGMAAYVLRQGQINFVIDNTLISAILFDNNDYSKQISKQLFVEAIIKMGVDPRDAALQQIQQLPETKKRLIAKKISPVLQVRKVNSEQSRDTARA